MSLSHIIPDLPPASLELSRALSALKSAGEGFPRPFDLPEPRTDTYHSYQQVYFIMLVGYKLYYKTELIPLTEVDLVSGRREFDEDEAAEDEKMAHDARPWWKKAWESA